MTDWELLACANQMLDQHGEDAAVQAAMRADALLETNDQRGHAVWCAIVRNIEKLTDNVGAGSSRH